MTRPDISFIIPVLNDAERLQRCLAAITASGSSGQIEVIVGDNGSDDASAEVATKAGAKIVLAPGISVGDLRNVAARSASGALLAFVDADHSIDSGWVRGAVRIFADSKIVAAGAPYSIPADANWIQQAYNRLRPSVRGQCAAEWLGSGNLIIRRDVFEALEGFDKNLESCEDVDLCNRLRAAGHTLVADERLASIHFGDPPTLRALFFGELWRGRNNIKVTLRGPLTLRALPSLIIPVVDLLCIGAGLMAVWFGAWLAILGAIAFGTLAVLRAARMTLARRPSGPIEFMRCLIVAVTYDAARSIALVVKVTHRTRREAAREHALA